MFEKMTRRGFSWMLVVLQLTGAMALVCFGCAGSGQEDALAEDYASSEEAEVADSLNVGVDEQSVGESSIAEKNEALELDDLPEVNRISVSELAKYVDEQRDLQIIDTRSIRSYGTGHIPEAKNIPAGRQIEVRINEFLPEKTIVLVASKDERLAEVWQTLVDLGIPADSLCVLDGGMVAWEKAGLPMKQEKQLGC